MTDFAGILAVKAPLTYVRSRSPGNLKITVLFNEIFKPLNPFAPLPSEITTEGMLSNYS